MLMNKKTLDLRPIDATQLQIHPGNLLVDSEDGVAHALVEKVWRIITGTKMKILQFNSKHTQFGGTILTCRNTFTGSNGF